jgi:membrane-bound serine protease (ClpP class)
MHTTLIVFLVLAISLVIFIIFTGVIGSITAHRRRVSTGQEIIIGTSVPVLTPLKPKGTVMLEGEIWKAVLDQGIARTGEEVVITCVKGLSLFVTKKEVKGGNC